MVFQYIIHFLKSKNATVSIEYGIGLALFGVVMAQSFNTTGTSLSGYMAKIAGG